MNSLQTKTKQQLILFILLVLCDLLSKAWIEQQQPFFHVEVISNFFNLVKAHNYGVAFSMFADWNHEWRTNLLLGVTTAIAVAVAVWWWKIKEEKGVESWLLILILAGASGNIWDRFTLGYVVDFIQWYVVIDNQAYTWPAFNFADAYISVAVVLLFILGFKKN